MTRRTLTWISCSIDVIARNGNIEPMNIRFIRTTANLYDITSASRWNGGINSNFKRASRGTGKNRINPTESHNHHPINIYYYSAVVERCDCWLWPFAVIAFYTAHNSAAAGLCRAFSPFLSLPCQLLARHGMARISNNHISYFSQVDYNKLLWLHHSIPTLRRKL